MTGQADRRQSRPAWADEVRRYRRVARLAGVVQHAAWVGTVVAGALIGWEVVDLFFGRFNGWVAAGGVGGVALGIFVQVAAFEWKTSAREEVAILLRNPWGSDVGTGA